MKPNIAISRENARDVRDRAFGRIPNPLVLQGVSPSAPRRAGATAVCDTAEHPGTVAAGHCYCAPSSSTRADPQATKEKGSFAA